MNAGREVPRGELDWKRCEVSSYYTFTQYLVEERPGKGHQPTVEEESAVAGDVHEHKLGQTHYVESDDGNRLQREAAKVGGTLVENVPDPAETEPHFQEWRTFKRGVNALIAQGHRGRFAVILGDKVHGTWDTLRDALMVARELFQGKVCFVQEIQPYLRPIRWGYRRMCHD